MTREIGEIFQYGELTLRVEEDERLCHGCAFNYNNNYLCASRQGMRVDYSITGECAPCHRNDKKSIIFKEVKQ